VRGPAHGTLGSVNQSTGVVSYTPASSYQGASDSFTYDATILGLTSAVATASITVAPPPGGFPAPTVSSVHLASSSFTVSKGTQLGLTLSAPASIKAVITQTTRGRRKPHGTCKASLSTGKRCTLVVRKATLTLAGMAGANALALVVPKTLKPGKYTLTITATGANGKTAKTLALKFTIKRR
jgi:hypothetical protein